MRPLYEVNSIRLVSCGRGATNLVNAKLRHLLLFCLLACSKCSVLVDRPKAAEQRLAAAVESRMTGAKQQTKA